MSLSTQNWPLPGAAHCPKWRRFLFYWPINMLCDFISQCTARPWASRIYWACDKKAQDIDTAPEWEVLFPLGAVVESFFVNTAAGAESEVRRPTIVNFVPIVWYLPLPSSNLQLLDHDTQEQLLFGGKWFPACAFMCTCKYIHPALVSLFSVCAASAAIHNNQIFNCV